MYVVLIKSIKISVNLIICYGKTSGNILKYIFIIKFS